VIKTPETTNSVEYRIEPASGISLNTSELWRYRELFYFFTWRDIKVKYKQTTLGFLWAVLQPLLLMVTFVLFLHRGLNLSTDGMPPDVFYLIGLLYWNLFASGFNGAANSLLEHAAIIKKIYFPRLIVPLSSILVALFDFVIANLIFLIVLVWHFFCDEHFTLSLSKILLLLPISLLLTLLTTVGLGCLVSALNVKYRDFRYIIPFATQFLFFLTPVIYPYRLISTPALKYILALNPMTGALVLARHAFNHDAIDWTVPAVGFASSVILIAIGLYTFRKMEAFFADIA